MMNPRLAAMAALCREVALPASVLVWIVAFGSAGINNTGAAPIADRLAPSLTAAARFTNKLPPIALGAADVVAASRPDAVAAGRPDVEAAGRPDVVAAGRPDAEAAGRSDVVADIRTDGVADSRTDGVADRSPDVVSPDVVAAGGTDVEADSRPVTPPAPADATPAASPEPAPIITAALTDPSETLPAEPSPEPAAKMSLADPEPAPANPAVGSIEVLDECFVVDICVDRYLWALYQRTPKQDAVTTHEQRNVTVKKKGKLVTVTRTVTATADEDFSWKDPKAAEKVGMPLADYVIGGMDRGFKLKLFHMLHVAEEQGLSPGITSAFRDDYRQSIASGLKAANDRSYHGGSFHGGYGHGLAADIVSVNGATRAQRLASTETLWKWVDAHGQEFGIGRPYLGRDPPHVGPIDGKEYADHHPGMKARQTASAAKPHDKLALRDDRGAAKHAKTAKSSKPRTIPSA